MSLTSALSSTLSGLQVSQAALGVTSRNIANVNTPGYGRGEIFQEASRSGIGVEIAEVRRAADRFLAKASYSAAADVGAAAVRADALDRSQIAFGDPNSDVSVFSRIDQAFAEFQGLAANPASPSQRRQAVDGVGRALETLEQAQQDLLAVRRDVELAIPDTVNEINSLLRQIADANGAVVEARAAGPDAVTAENTRSQLFDRLSELVDIQINETGGGFAEVRTTAGALLTGLAPAQIEAGTNASGQPTLTLVTAEGQSSDFGSLVQSGRLAGLMDLATTELPALGSGLASLANSFATAINQANLHFGIVSWGIWTPEPLTTNDNVVIRMNYDDPVAILNTPGLTPLEAQAALIDGLDDLLLGGRMSPALRADLVGFFAALPAWYDTSRSYQEQRVRGALYLIFNSPEFPVQR